MGISAVALHAGGDPAILVDGSTADATPIDLWTDPGGADRLLGAEALVWAEETGLNRSNYQHWKVVCSVFVTAEGNALVTSTELGAGGSQGAGEWAAVFAVDENGVLVLRVTGAQMAINWHAAITLRPSA